MSGAWRCGRLVSTMRRVTLDPKAWPLVIGCVSDTHIPTRASYLPGRLLAALAGVDLILHAGDLVSEEILTPLRLVAPVEAVAGNMDPPGLAEDLDRAVLLSAGPWRIGLTHGDEGPGRTTPERALGMFRGVDVVVFGHSHRPLNERWGGVLLLNPGSATNPRRELRPSCAILTLPDPAARLRPEADIVELEG